MNILSLFDGKSSGYTAAELAGIKVTNYYSAEVDKYAIQVSEAIHPNQTRLGDVTKWREWNIDWSSIDLIIAGSPCQGFSFAGKQLAFDDPRSKLFFVFVDILNHIKSLNPDVKFMLENVKMKKEFIEVINHCLEFEPVLINSALVSAQNRQRLYWCNWDVEQPEDKGIMLADIIDDDEQSYTFMSEKFVNRQKGRKCLRDDISGKAVSLSAMEYVKNGRQGDYLRCGSMIGRRINPDTGKRDDYNKEIPATQRIEIRSDDKTGTLTTVQKDNLVIVQKPRGNNQGGIRAKDGKTPCLSSNSWEHNNHLTDGIKYRKLTPRECFRLQTVPEHYIDKILACGVSNSQLYKIAGNGWTDEVIAHIFRALK